VAGTDIEKKAKVALRVLLVYPRAGVELIGWGDLGAIAEPLALEYAGAAARMDSHDVELLDLRLHPQGLEATLSRFRPDVVGFTGYSMHVLRNLELCRRVKQLLPECKTAIGGHHATLLPEDYFEPEVDFVLVGEGVAAFRAVLRHLEQDRPVFVPGVWTRRQGRFESGGEARPFRIDDLPPPDRTLTQHDRSAYFIDWMKPIALARTTVGCPYRCSFCSLWKIMDGKYNMREIDGVVDELAAVPEECVFLVDDEAFINRARMRELAHAIRAAGVRKRYFTYCRIDSLLRERELLGLWRDIGLERLFIGIEAVSARALEDYNKRLTIAQIEAGLAAAREMGIAVFAGFIVGTDFTRQDFKELVRFIEHNRVEYPSFTILTPLPGTASLCNFDAVTERQPNGRPNWELFDLQHPVTPTRLTRPAFMQEYENLQSVFAGRSLPYRPELGFERRQPAGRF
jgi:radical SAM superfamily enzyme YgiQ (UPF0313 family)